jgi:hypothetical protein
MGKGQTFLWACTAMVIYVLFSELMDIYLGHCGCSGLCPSTIPHIVFLLVSFASLGLLTAADLWDQRANRKAGLPSRDSLATCKPLFIAVVTLMVFICFYPQTEPRPEGCTVQAMPEAQRMCAHQRVPADSAASLRRSI